MVVFCEDIGKFEIMQIVSYQIYRPYNETFGESDIGTAVTSKKFQTTSLDLYRSSTKIHCRVKTTHGKVLREEKNCIWLLLIQGKSDNRVLSS